MLQKPFLKYLQLFLKKIGLLAKIKSKDMVQLALMITSIALLTAITIITTALFNYMLKKRAIRFGQIDIEYLKLLTQTYDYKLNGLKWSILLLFGGVGLLVIDWIPGKFASDSPTPFGIEAIFLAIGFYVYYLVISKNKK